MARRRTRFQGCMASELRGKHPHGRAGMKKLFRKAAKKCSR